MKKRLIMVFTMLALSAMLVLLASCGKPTPLAVDSPSLSTVTPVNNTTDTTKPPVTYSATVTWSTDTILADKTAGPALTNIQVSCSDLNIDETLSADATSYTFTGMVPGEHYSLHVDAVYVDGTYDSSDLSDADASVYFIGGPWFDGTTSAVPAYDSGFSVGSFNKVDSIPSSSFTVSDVYYYNPYYNTDYVFSEVGDVVWLVVDVPEKTDTNDASDQRDNVNWLGNGISIFDANSPRALSTEDLSKVSVTIYDIYGNEIASATGSSDTSIGSSAITTWVNSVNSGYYTDKDGVYFIKAVCTAMPDTFSTDNSDQKGWWGLAVFGPKVIRE